MTDPDRHTDHPATRKSSPACPYCHHHDLRGRKDGSWYCRYCNRRMTADLLVWPGKNRGGTHSGNYAGPRYHADFRIHVKGKP